MTMGLMHRKHAIRLALKSYLLALCATPAWAEAEGPLPSMISFTTAEQHVKLYGKGGPKAERFTIEGRKALMAKGNRFLGGGYAGTCSGLPADYGEDAKRPPYFLYRMGENIVLNFTCKYSIAMADVTMKSTSSYVGGLLTLKSSADFTVPDLQLVGSGEEEAIIDLSGGKCIVKHYRLFDRTRRQESHSVVRERTDIAGPNVPCYRSR